MKKIIFAAIAFCAYGFGLAQQEQQYSQYMQNNFIINPAEGGTEEFADLQVGYRSQWIGLDGAPSTFYISGHAPINKEVPRHSQSKQLPFFGAGGYIYQDQIGPSKRTAAYGSFAYHLPVSAKNDFVISFGMFAGIKSYQLNENELEFYSENEFNVADDAVNNVQTKIMPDVAAGIWGYSNNYYFGIASYQLIQNKISFYNPDESNFESGNLKMHHFITGGYKIQIDSNWLVVPSVMIKAVAPAPVQFDLNAKVRYQDKAWAGISYRNKDSFIAMVGVTAKGLIDISYAFDFTTSPLRNFNSGTHEIVVGLRFPTHDHPIQAQYW